VKRIVGLPGDHVVYRNKHAIVNGRDSRIRQLGDYVDPNVPRYSPQFRDKLDDTEFDTLVQNDHPQLTAEPNDFPFRDHCRYSAEEFSCDVPAGNYFVMGDNRDNTFDSRYWGFVRADLIIGKVVKMLR
jgi:signal peptidase I